jgi:hypothetical protein
MGRLAKLVMAGLVPAIHAVLRGRSYKTGMAGTSLRPAESRLGGMLFLAVAL